MRPGYLKLVYRLKCLITQEVGQDLVEYALVIALIAFGATAGMNRLAKGVNTAFSIISSTLAADL
jgi:pilus assembly protein Flp/PilA